MAFATLLAGTCNTRLGFERTNDAYTGKQVFKTEKSLDDYTPDIDNTSRYASAALELRFEEP